jgi:hypothetical protein
MTAGAGDGLAGGDDARSGTLPALMALRSAIDARYSSPRSRTVVKPANKVRSAYTTASMATSASFSL